MGDERKLLEGLVVGECVGAGADADVHRARFRGVEVAVKRRRTAGPGEVRRAFTEAEWTSLVADPCVVTVFDWGIDPASGLPCAVLEWADAGTLADVIAERASSGRGFGVEEIRSVCRQIARGLDALHHYELIHRDLKPANVLCFRDGGEVRCKVADLGLARDAAADLAVWTTATGTLPYSPPEQRVGKVSERGDVYALAMVVAELALMELPARPWPWWRGLLPQELRDPLSLALSEDPTLRPATAGEFADLVDGKRRAAVPEPQGNDGTFVVGDSESDRTLLAEEVARLLENVAERAMVVNDCVGWLGDPAAAMSPVLFWAGQRSIAANASEMLGSWIGRLPVSLQASDGTRGRAARLGVDVSGLYGTVAEVWRLGSTIAAQLGALAAAGNDEECRRIYDRVRVILERFSAQAAVAEAQGRIVFTALGTGDADTAASALIAAVASAEVAHAQFTVEVRAADRAKVEKERERSELYETLRPSPDDDLSMLAGKARCWRQFGQPELARGIFEIILQRWSDDPFAVLYAGMAIAFTDHYEKFPDGGVLVLVNEQGTLAKAGMVDGDIVVRVAGERVSHPEQVDEAVKAATGPVTFDWLHALPGRLVSRSGTVSGSPLLADLYPL
ncbi:MAG: protein kinase [Acidimicrobiia bacterium]